MKFTAHLCLIIDTESLKVLGAGIYSEAAHSLTRSSKREYAEVTSTWSSVGFAEADEELRRTVAEQRSLAWIRPLLR